MQRYTVMVIPEGAAAPRRFRVAAAVVRRVVWSVAVVGIAVAAICADYVRVRFDVVELDALRVETATQRRQIEDASQTLAELESQLARIQELERKIRLIADLPTASAGRGDGIIGVGGGSERAVREPLPEPEEKPAAADRSAQLEALGMPATAQAAGLGTVTTGARAAVHAARLRREGERLAAEARSQEVALRALVEQLEDKRQRLASTPSIWPTEGWLTSRFGYRISPFTGRRQLHAGIDIAAGPGTRVVAPARGRVVFSGRKGPLGRTVVIDHGYGMRTTFGHAAELMVRNGERVTRGQVIAAVGSSGRSTGPHLHYAIQVNGRAVDPLNYILE